MVNNCEQNVHEKSDALPFDPDLWDSNAINSKCTGITNIKRGNLWLEMWGCFQIIKIKKKKKLPKIYWPQKHQSRQESLQVKKKWKKRRSVIDWAKGFVGMLSATLWLHFGRYICGSLVEFYSDIFHLSEIQRLSWQSIIKASFPCRYFSPLASLLFLFFVVFFFKKSVSRGLAASYQLLIPITALISAGTADQRISQL